MAPISRPIYWNPHASNSFEHAHWRYKSVFKPIRGLSLDGRKRYQNDKCGRKSFWKGSKTAPFSFENGLVWTGLSLLRLRRTLHRTVTLYKDTPLINNFPAVPLFCYVRFFPDSKAVSVRILFNSGPLTCLLRTNYFENKTTSIFVLQESINNDSQLPGGPQQKLFRSCSKMFPSVFFFP